MKSSDLLYSASVDCPLCNCAFQAEKILSKKVAPRRQDLSLRSDYGETLPIQDPLIYLLLTCPHCLFTAFEGDFEESQVKHRPDLREIAAECRAALKTMDIDPREFAGLRDLRIGLGAYYLAEIWYRRRTDVPTQHFRLGLTFYRRRWILDLARNAGVISEGHYLTDRKACLIAAESNFEHSYLKERLPDRIFYGPDYGPNNGPATVPYCIAVINYTLGIESAAPGDRLTYFQKASKFVRMTQAALASEGKAAPLRSKVVDLKDLLKQGGVGDDPEPQRTVQPTVDIESVSWSLPFEKLYERFGKRFEPGAVIIKEGEASRELYLILEGRVNIIKQFGEPKLIATLGNGSFFGEMALIDSGARVATAMAVEPTRAIRMTRPDFEEMIRTYPDVALSILDVLVHRLRRYDRFVQKHLVPLIATAQDGAGDPLRVELSGLMSEVEDREY